MVVIMLIGIPASGKTTLAHSLKSMLCENVQCCSSAKSSTCAQIFSFDDELEEIDPLLENVAHFNRHVWQRKVKRTISSISENYNRNDANCAQVPQFAILDDTFHLKSMRRPFLRLSKTLNIPLFKIYLNCPVELALERNKLRPVPVCKTTSNDIMNIFHNFDLDNELTYGNLIEIGISDEHKYDMFPIIAMILDASRIYLEDKSISLKPRAENYGNNSDIPKKSYDSAANLDQDLRKSLTKCLASLPALRKDALSLNYARVALLKEMRQMKITTWTEEELTEKLKAKYEEGNRSNFPI